MVADAAPVVFTDMQDANPLPSPALNVTSIGVADCCILPHDGWDDDDNDDCGGIDELAIVALTEVDIWW